jgi:hypothetical protein
MQRPERFEGGLTGALGKLAPEQFGQRRGAFPLRSIRDGVGQHALSGLT